MLNLLALERMMEKEKCYWGSEKSSDWFLKQEKAVYAKKEIKKKRERASRKSQ